MHDNKVSNPYLQKSTITQWSLQTIFLNIFAFSEKPQPENFCGFATTHTPFLHILYVYQLLKVY